MDKLLRDIRRCTICANYLPCAPNPIVRASKRSEILIIGQAPGQKVNDTGIPWNDASGNELRRWLGVGKEQFYDADIFALVPMGFCYPGKGTSGDLPPRPECASTWHELLLHEMSNVQLTLLIGQYAQKYYLPTPKTTLTENVKAFHEFLPVYLPLVHPSPRNKIWQKRNPWFKQDVVTELQKIVGKILH